MWRQSIKTPFDAAEPKPQNLKDAIRKARIETAERTGVVVDLRDAELARLELLNEALDPVFGDVPKGIELFDRGISQGDPHACGSMPSRMSRWIATSGFIVSSRIRGSAGKFLQKRRRSRKWSERSPA